MFRLSFGTYMAGGISFPKFTARVSPSLNRFAALMQRVYRVRDLIVANPLARVALVSVQTDLFRVHKLIKRHRATCAQCKLNRPLEPTAPRRSLAAKLRRRPMRRKRRRLEVVGTLSPLPIFVRLRSKKEPLLRAAGALARRELSEIVLRALQSNDYFRIADDPPGTTKLPVQGSMLDSPVLNK
jgi:hypothetical protein